MFSTYDLQHEQTQQKHEHTKQTYGVMNKICKYTQTNTFRHCVEALHSIIGLNALSGVF